MGVINCVTVIPVTRHYGADRVSRGVDVAAVQLWFSYGSAVMRMKRG